METVSIEKMPKKARFQTAYCKKITSGNVVQFMEMSAVPQQPPIEKISGSEYVDKRTGEVKEFNKSENRSENKDSLRKTFKRIRDLINSNCTDVQKLHWITLTYAENMTDTKKLYSDFHAFWKRFKYYCKKQGWKPPEYITVIEPQARGAWHCHCLFIWDMKRPYIDNNKVFAKIWGNGFTKIKSVPDNCDNLGAYLSAYLGDIPLEQASKTTEGTIKKLPNGKKYVKGGRLNLYPVGTNIVRTSRGIKRPSQEVITPETVETHKACSGNKTFRSVFKITDDGNQKVRYVSKEYYNIKRNTSQVQKILSDALAMGISVSPMKKDKGVK